MIDLKTRRFVLDDDQNGVNLLFGLYDLIKDNVQSNFIVCEIGSYRGVSSELFATHVRELVCVDPWIPYWDGMAGGINELNTINAAENEFDQRMLNYSNVKKIKKTSEEAYKLFEDNYFDLIYIDGSHTYENVKKDILNWKNKVKIGGYICGHDYNLSDIKNAVADTLPNQKIKTYSDTSWSVKKIS